MKMQKWAFIFFSMWLISCSTQKNTFIHRGFHNLTNRFNGYYYSCENINDGIYKIEKNHKEIYEQVLPIFIFPTKEAAKTTFPEFDKTIKKSSVCIQRHTIKNEEGQEIPDAGKWIDNNWINIGIAHLYKHELFSAIENFDYVIRTYTHSEDRYWAMFWICRAYHELGSTVSAEPFLNQLKSAKRLPGTLKEMVPILLAEFYLKRNQTEEAAKQLQKAGVRRKFFSPKGLAYSPARLSFISGQLFEQLGNLQQATRQYEKTLTLKPSFELEFYTTMRLTRMPTASKVILSRTKKKLLRMIAEQKNSDYADVLYYTLGLLEEREQHDLEALAWFNKSIRSSTQNANQKALSYMKLGSYYFKVKNYISAGFYYDSTVQLLSKTHPDFMTASLRKKTLKQIIYHTHLIEETDSLQRIAKLPEAEQKAFITKVLLEQQKKLKEAQDQADALAQKQNTLGANPFNGAGALTANNGTFYFYNPNTVALGIADFSKKWGNRPLEPNWRRSNKSIQIRDIEENTEPTQKNKPKEFNLESAIEDCIKKLPLNDSLMELGTRTMIKSYYELGLIYKEELKEYPLAITTLETLNRRFTNHTYYPQSLFLLYHLHRLTADTSLAESFKSILLQHFPNSEYTQRILHPEDFNNPAQSESNLKAQYAELYEQFKSGNFAKTQELSMHLSQTAPQFMKPELELIRVLCMPLKNNKDSLVKELSYLVNKYPKTPVAEECQLMIRGLQDVKITLPAQQNMAEPLVYHPDSMYFFKDTLHSVLVLIPDQAAQIVQFKQRLSQFNAVYYANSSFQISSSLFNSKQQAILIKGFTNAETALAYYKNLNSDTDVFLPPLNKQSIDLWPISDLNLKILFKRKNIAQLQELFLKHYMTL